MSTRSPGGGRYEGSYLPRQRALLYRMLHVTREQRRCLIEGDVKGLSQTNRLLRELLESHVELHRRFPDWEGCPDGAVLAELRELARLLQEESRTNYFLACRGAQFAEFSLAMASRDASEDGQTGLAAYAATSPRVLDTKT